jgi:hypothetical protein
MLENILTEGTVASWIKDLKLESGEQCYHWKGKSKRCCYGKQQIKVSDGKGNTVKALWLPYVPKMVNQCGSEGLDVISGPFTGCIMGAYDNEFGMRVVCHVATGTGCEGSKDEWKTIAENSSYVVAFQPSNIYKSKKLTKSVGFGLSTKVFGIITPNPCHCHAVVINYNKKYPKIIKVVRNLREEVRWWEDGERRIAKLKEKHKGGRRSGKPGEDWIFST